MSQKVAELEKIFKSFIRRINGSTDKDRLDVVINFIDTNVYSYITECTTYVNALNKLERAHAKPVDEIYARNRLNTTRKNENESLEDFLQRLKILSNDCNFLNVRASQCKEAAIKDAFITGFGSPNIRQRLIEDKIYG